MTRPPSGISVVVPTVGRPSLAALLAALGDLDAGCDVGGVPVELLLVDDRPRPGAAPRPPGRVLRGAGRGPAAARNVGWRAARYEWVAFLDDDVLPEPGWLRDLVTDLTVDEAVGGVQGRLRVPLPAGRRPTDWERCTAGLADGRWITADIAYRRRALAAAGGFDERFPRAFREDAELALRVRRAGFRLVRGDRLTVHPVRPEGPWVSLHVQRGNADDALLRRMYGAGWRDQLGIPPGRRHRHALVTAAGVAAAALALAPPGFRWRPALAAGAALGWAAGTAEFAAARIAPGPRTPREVLTMVATSALIPPLASAHWLRGWLASRGAAPLPVRARESGYRQPIEKEPTCASR